MPKLMIAKLKKGFTLIELLVSMGLFSVVMVVCMGSILTILDANDKAQSASSIMTNLQVALDGMSREMRTGTGFVISDGDRTITFTTQDGIFTTYKFEDVNGTGAITKTTPTTVTAVPITAPEVILSTPKSRFMVIGTQPATYPTCDIQQPYVYITITGTVGIKERVSSSFTIQTHISQRFLDAETSSPNLCHS